MRATILLKAIILTKAYRAMVSIIAKGCIVALVLPLRCFLFLLPNYINICAIIMQYFHILTRGKYCNRNTPNPNDNAPLLQLTRHDHYSSDKCRPNIAIKAQTLKHTTHIDPDNEAYRHINLLSLLWTLTLHTRYCFYPNVKQSGRKLI